MDSSADRLATIDAFASEQLVDLQYVDDLAAPASSSEQVASIWRGCQSFASAHHLSFNLGANKTAALPVGDTRYVFTQVGAVTTYPYLGVTMDQWMTFQSHLDMLLHRGRSSFMSFYGAAESLGLPVPVMAQLIPNRVQSKALYGIEFCIHVNAAEHSFNRLQIDWARNLLGVTGAKAGKWSILLAECGWQRRLGTRMAECAIMLKARVSLLPLGHPARRFMELASRSSYDTWCTKVAKWQISLSDNAIPDITSVFPSASVEDARVNAIARRKLVRQYRERWVRPAADAYDNKAFEAVTFKIP